jgi:hypothetical protein
LEAKAKVSNARRIVRKAELKAKEEAEKE